MKECVYGYKRSSLKYWKCEIRLIRNTSLWMRRPFLDTCYGRIGLSQKGMVLIEKLNATKDALKQIFRCNDFCRRRCFM